MKTVFITGAGRRIGRGLAIKFAERGWNIAINYNDSEKEAIVTLNQIRSLGVKANIFKADVKNSSEVKSAIEAAFAQFENVNVVINNAGIYPEAKKLIDISDELWDTTINTNLKGEFFVAREFSKLALENSKIINIASLGAFDIWKQRLPYNVSKAAVIQLTKALARELAPKISVNSVSPGSILIPEDIATQDLAIDLKKIPMGRYGSIEDIFEAVYFFAECTNFITGQNLNVDGGYYLKN